MIDKYFTTLISNSMMSFKDKIATGYENEITTKEPSSMAGFVGSYTGKLLKIFLTPVQRAYIVDRFENRLYDGKEGHPTVIKNKLQEKIKPAQNKTEQTEIKVDDIQTFSMDYIQQNECLRYKRDETADYKDISNGAPSDVVTLSGMDPNGYGIVTKVIGGSCKGPRGYEFDLVLRYIPYHFSRGGCYNHYFLNGQFTGLVTRTATRSHNEFKIISQKQVQRDDYLRPLHINTLKRLTQELESHLNASIIKEDQFQKITL